MESIRSVSYTHSHMPLCEPVSPVPLHPPSHRAHNFNGSIPMLLRLITPLHLTASMHFENSMFKTIRFDCDFLSSLTLNCIHISVLLWRDSFNNTRLYNNSIIGTNPVSKFELLRVLLGLFTEAFLSAFSSSKDVPALKVHFIKDFRILY
jgi:hypothetical protein